MFIGDRGIERKGDSGTGWEGSGRVGKVVEGLDGCGRVLKVLEELGMFWKGWMVVEGFHDFILQILGIFMFRMCHRLYITLLARCRNH